MRICIIPARGASKRIPRKNVRPFLGVPAIARTIGLVHSASVVDRIVVSTDDQEVSGLARTAGAEVPGIRPASLADDHTTTVEVVRHALLAWMPEVPADTPVVVVYPTAVLLRPEDLSEGLRRFASRPVEFLMPVVRYRHPVERRVHVTDDGRIRIVEPQHANTRTQDLPVSFHDAGQFYIGRRDAWLSATPMTSQDTIAYELSPDKIVDIDTEEDWKSAEQLARLFDDGPHGATRS